MTDWGIPSQPLHSDAQQPVSVLLAHSDIGRTAAWYQALHMDQRFRITSMANDPADLRAKLASSPEVILLDAMLFDGPSAMVSTLTSISGAVYVLVPPAFTESAIADLKAIPAVKSVFTGDLNLADFSARAYADALALRRSVPALSADAWAGGRTAAASIGGMRILTVWSRAGGTGKTTVASALALAVARKHLKSLLIGLGSPDVAPLMLGLQPEPNITGWVSNPTDDGLRACLQSLGGLHVIAGFPDILSEAYGDRPAEDKGSLTELVVTATYGGYAAIVLDTPAAGVLTPRAISSANTWLMVARPTLADAWSCVDAFRMVTQRAAGQHRIAPGNIFVVLNQRTPGMMTADEWHRAADAACRKMGLSVGFPPVVATIPYAAEVGMAQDNGRSALDASDEFARPIHKLADMLFGGNSSASQSAREDGNVFKLGPLKIRTK